MEWRGAEIEQSGTYEVVWSGEGWSRVEWNEMEWSGLQLILQPLFQIVLNFHIPITKEEACMTTYNY